MYYVGGHEARCEYFASGPAVKDSFDAGDVAKSGDVILAETVWNVVKDVSQGKLLEKGFYSLDSMDRTFRKRSVNRMTRQALGLSPGALSVLRSYAPPILLSAHSVDASLNHQSVRGWTVSVVQASVLFINLGIGGFMDATALDCDKIHTAVVTVQRIVQTLQGCIHRFTVDDKGCVMKVVFGAHLPHEDQPYRALLAALQIRQTLSVQGIQPAVGVASGESLIGPVGSAVRQEFTVHGDKIILAARLMQLAAKYGGMVLCDESTFQATRDDVRFVHLRPVELKGKSTTVRPYRPVTKSELLEKPELAAKPTSEYCLSLEPIRRALEDCATWLADDTAKFHGLIVTGPHGSGKTQLLMQIRSILEPACRVLHVRCREHEVTQRGSLLRRLFAQLCAHDVWPSLQHITGPMVTGSLDSTDDALIEYELKILRSHAAAIATAKDDTPAHALAEDGCDTIGKCHPNHQAFGSTATPIVSDDLKDHAASRLVLIIDDVHHADAHSCELLRRLAESGPATVVLLLTCREPRVNLSVASCATGEEGHLLPGHRLVHTIRSSQTSSESPSIFACHLRPLGASGCDEHGCAALRVSQLPAEVSAVLAKRSGGSPLLCQAIANNMLRRGALQVARRDEQAVCILGPAFSERLANASATEALVKARHSMVCVKMAELSVLQQVILKVMSLLPEMCSQSQIVQAVPVQIDAATLSSHLRILRERHLICVPSSHRRSLPGILKAKIQDAVYIFADVGMREVCLHLMVESQKRQIRLRIAAADESKQTLGSLADSISSSMSSEDLARSLSPNMLRMERSRSPHASSAKSPSSELLHRSDSEGHFARRKSTAEDRQWWLSRSLSQSPMGDRSKSGWNKQAVSPKISPSRLHTRVKQDTSPTIPSRLRHSRFARSQHSQLAMSPLSSSSRTSPTLSSLWSLRAKTNGGLESQHSQGPSALNTSPPRTKASMQNVPFSKHVIFGILLGTVRRLVAQLVLLRRRNRQGTREKVHPDAITRVQSTVVKMPNSPSSDSCFGAEEAGTKHVPYTRVLTPPAVLVPMSPLLRPPKSSTASAGKLMCDDHAVLVRSMHVEQPEAGNSDQLSVAIRVQSKVARQLFKE